MAAFVLAPTTPPRVQGGGTRLDIFPGSATPTVFAARTPFWIGYGFVPAPAEPGPSRGVAAMAGGTRFELAVDGESVEMRTETAIESGRTVSTLTLASFEAGLPAGWHRFAGRWYVDGSLVLSSDTSVEFVEA